jgi:HK97 family phage prohead protease
MNQASYDIAEFKAVDGEPEGLFAARVSVFGNVDRNGDRVMPGAFTKSLERWRASGKKIPVLWSHERGDPESYIGSVDPIDVKETDDGVVVAGRLDIDESARAKKVFDLLSKGLVNEWSFTYKVNDEKVGNDLAREIHELDLFEFSPTLIGANEGTSTLAMKSATVEDMKLDPAIEAEVAKFESEIDSLIETKIGRVISRKTEAKIRSALAHLTEVLSALDEEAPTAQDSSPPEEKAAEEPSPPSETELMRQAVLRNGLFLAERNR